MNKRMRELQAAIQAAQEEAKSFMAEDNKDLDKAQAALDKADELQREFDMEKRLFEAEKSKAPGPKDVPAKANGFKAMAKLLARKALNDEEKALISGTDPTARENYLVPEDVKAEIN